MNGGSFLLALLFIQVELMFYVPRVTTYLDIPPQASVALHLVAMASFFGTSGYNCAGTMLGLSHAAPKLLGLILGYQPSITQKWTFDYDAWWTEWLQMGFAVMASVGGPAWLLCAKAGSWQKAVENLEAKRKNAAQGKSENTGEITRGL